MPPHNLHLKIGLPIMLLRNINPNAGLCNGTRLKILKVFARLIQAEISFGNLSSFLIKKNFKIIYRQKIDRHISWKKGPHTENEFNSVGHVVTV